jgi:hypothetical protein
MELLVEEEVAQQFQALPASIAAYVNQGEWVAHALNQLPPLYATSETGLYRQLQTGKSKYRAAIKQSVQRALAAIRRDPLRRDTPLQFAQVPQDVLFQLRFLLSNDQLDWDTLPLAVEQALNQNSQKRQSSPGSTLGSTVQASSESLPQRSSAKFSSTLSNQRFKPKQSTPTLQEDSPEEPFGWDDPLYNPR